MKIYGEIRNAKDGQPMENSSIAVINSSGVANWTVKGAPGGKFSVPAATGDLVQITHVGYKPVTIIDTAFGDGNMGVIKLEPDFKEMPEIIITPQKHLIPLVLVALGLLWFFSRKNKK